MWCNFPRSYPSLSRQFACIGDVGIESRTARTRHAPAADSSLPQLMICTPLTPPPLFDPARNLPVCRCPRTRPGRIDRRMRCGLGPARNEILAFEIRWRRSQMLPHHLTDWATLLRWAPSQKVEHIQGRSEVLQGSNADTRWDRIRCFTSRNEARRLGRAGASRRPLSTHCCSADAPASVRGFTARLVMRSVQATLDGARRRGSGQRKARHAPPARG